MKYSLQMLKTLLFKRHKYPSPNALNIKYFWTLSYNHWAFLGITKYQIHNFKKTVCPPKSLDLALPWIWLIFTNLWDQSNCWKEWLLSKLSAKHGTGRPCTDRSKKILFNVWIVSACYIQAEDFNALLQKTRSEHFLDCNC